MLLSRNLFFSFYLLPFSFGILYLLLFSMHNNKMRLWDARYIWAEAKQPFSVCIIVFVIVISTDMRRKQTM